MSLVHKSNQAIRFYKLESFNLIYRHAKVNQIIRYRMPHAGAIALLTIESFVTSVANCKHLCADNKNVNQINAII